MVPKSSGLMLPVKPYCKIYMSIQQEISGQFPLLLSRDKILLVLNDDKYARIAEKVGSIFKDNAVHPLENAVYHVEFLMRHGDVDHLKPKNRHLNVIQMNLLDVWLFIVVVVLFVIYLTFRCLKCSFSLCRRSPRKTKTA